jgi:hypothetical protein
MNSALFVVPLKMMPIFFSIVIFQDLSGLRLTHLLEQISSPTKMMEFKLSSNRFFLLPPLTTILTKLFSLCGTCGKLGMITGSIGRPGPLGKFTTLCKLTCHLSLFGYSASLSYNHGRLSGFSQPSRQPGPT